MSLALGISLFLSCFLIGDRLHALAGWRDADPAERLVFGLAAGILLASFLVTLLALAGWIGPVSGWGLLILFYLSYFGQYRQLVQTAGQSLKRHVFPAVQSLYRTGLETGLAWALGALFFLSLVWAQAPPARQDALVYHLAIPKAYLEAGGLINLPNNKYSFYPLFNEMNFLWAMSLDQEPLPLLTGCGWMFLLALALSVYARRHLPSRWTLAPAVLYLATPTFLETGAQGYIDVAAALWVFLSYYSWERWRTTHRRRWGIRLLLFSAAALASKLTLFLIVPLTVLGILLQDKKQPAKNALQWLAGYGLTLLLLMGPWWVRNVQYTGNPFTPFLMEPLGGADQINWDSTRSKLEAEMIKNTGTGNGPDDFLALPYSLTFRSRQHGLPFDGNIGILYFMMLPSLLWLHWRGRGSEAERNRRLALLIGLYIAVWFLYFKGIRFLAPPFTLLTILLCTGTARMAHHFPRSTPWGRPAAILVLAGGLAFNFNILGQEWLHTGPARFLTGKESRAEYLSRRLEPYPLYQEINQRLQPPDRALFVFMRNYGYLAEVPFHSDSLFEAHTLQQMLKGRESADSLLLEFHRRGFTHLMFDTTFTFGTTSAFSHKQQELLKEFLNTYGNLIARHPPFYLYEIHHD